MSSTEQSTTMCAAFQHIASVDPEALALRTPGDSRQLTWREYAAQVRQCAAGFASLGIGRGDTVALMMSNRIEFYPLDVGALHVGATSFSIYNTLAPEAIRHVLANAGAAVVVCEEQYVQRIRDAGVPLQGIVVVDPQPGGVPGGTIALDEFMARDFAEFDFEGRWRSVRPEDVATLIYTSGTTGNPKGVESTHEALLFEARAVGRVLPIAYGDRITSFMPSAHIADRMTALYFQLVFGTQVTIVNDAQQIAGALPECRPTIWGAVPRVWEKLKAAVEHSIESEPDPQRQQALRWAVRTGRDRVERQHAGKPVPAEIEAEYAKADKEVLQALRAKLGFGELKWALSGAAPISVDTLLFFAALGIPISEIWGMSELTCIASIAPAEPAKLGTVGMILPGLEHHVAEDGELLVRGPLVMKGYRGESAKTAEAIDAQGWLHTGDVVSSDEDGYLTVIDRKKDMIINASGKNMSPANIEKAIQSESALVGTVVAIGESRPYNTALIALNSETAPSYAVARGVDSGAASMATHPDVIAAISAAVAAGNAKLARTEQIKRFAIPAEYWEPGGDELTLTMKLRRAPIAEKYAAEIERLYTNPLPAGVSEPAEV